MDLIKFCKQLLSCPSITPNDAGCQEIIASILNQNGFDTQQSYNIDTYNLIASKGNPQQPALVLLGHTDVVPPGHNWSTKPFEPKIIDNKLFARGAVDMKVAVACMVKAACDLSINNGRIAIMLTSDEEGRGDNGIFKVLPAWQKKLGKIGACLVGEPTSNHKLGDTIKLGRRGSINAKIAVLGTQGHAAYPELAASAITKAAKLAILLETNIWDQALTTEFPATRLVCTGIESMSNTCNIIPGSCELAFNIRYNPSNNIEQIKHQVEQIAATAEIKFLWQDWCPSNGGPYQSAPGLLTSNLLQAIKQETGIDAKYSYDGGTSDARFVSEYCSEVVEFGALRQYAHKADENIHLDEIQKLYQIYLNTIQKFIDQQS